MDILLEVNIGEEEKRILPGIADKYNLYKSGGTDHDGLLGGFAHLDDRFNIPDDVGVISEEDFMEIYNRVKG